MSHSVYTESKRTIVIRGQKAEHHEYIFSRCSATSLSYHPLLLFLSPYSFFIPSKPCLPLFSRNFSAPSVRQAAYCSDRTLKYSHSKFRPRRDKGSEFKFRSSCLERARTPRPCRTPSLCTHRSISIRTIGENQSPAAFLPLFTFFVSGIVSNEF